MTNASENIVEVAEERLQVKKRLVPKGSVRVRTVTETTQEVASGVLEHHDVEITRVPIGETVERMPAVRTEGGVTIVPVVEEVLVVEKRLVLKEEVRIRRRTKTETVEVPVTVRKQHAIVDRRDDMGSSHRNGEVQMMNETSPGMNSTLTAFFDNKGEADRAVSRLIEAGVANDAIRLLPGNKDDRAAPAGPEVHRGFFESLAEFFLPDEDRHSYAEGLSRGGYLVTVTNLNGSLYATALDILDDEGAVDFDQREAGWRSEGWSGDSTGAVGGSTMADSGMARGAAIPDTGTDQTIPVVEEELRIGKRDVNLGRVRVRSYTLEEPVTEKVDLLDERVTLERRPVDRPLASADEAFQDRTLEAEEHAEEAVVSKDARVVEEIALRKEDTRHQETVSDTVRRTEVEIEDERDNAKRDRGASKP
jgi:uncharacterized protein (TIGR02271 family)